MPFASSRLISTVIAIALALSLPILLRLTQYPTGQVLNVCIVPALAFLFLRLPAPPIRISAAHWAISLTIVLALAVETVLIVILGWAATYREWSKAIPVALFEILFLFFIHRLREPSSSEGVSLSVSGWFYVAAAVLTYVLLPEPEAIQPLQETAANLMLIGMAEEFVYRGVIQTILSKHWSRSFLGLSAANWMTAILFAWTHNVFLTPDRLPWMVYLLPMGLLFGLVRDRTGSWFVSGVAHGIVTPVIYGMVTLGLVSLPL